MASEFIYKVASEFSRYPGGRLRSHGEFSGQAFREDVVLSLLNVHEKITFDLSGSAGYSSGFLDEAFGELGAILGFSEVKRRIRLIATDDAEAIEIAWKRIKDASDEAHKN
jgi:hypothetical protein